MPKDGVDLEDGAAGVIQGLISNLHSEAHDAVVNVKNTIFSTVDAGEYSGHGATATRTTMEDLQKFWDAELEPILTALYELVGGAGEELAAQDQLGAQQAAAVNAGSGMTAKAGRL